MVRAGERLVYLARMAHDGHWAVEGGWWLSIEANDRRSALEATRAAVAAWLGVDPNAFDVLSD